jgi:hypothetical protein
MIVEDPREQIPRTRRVGLRTCAPDSLDASPHSSTGLSVARSSHYHQVTTQAAQALKCPEKSTS